MCEISSMLTINNSIVEFEQVFVDWAYFKNVIIKNRYVGIINS